MMTSHEGRSLYSEAANGSLDIARERSKTQPNHRMKLLSSGIVWSFLLCSCLPITAQAKDKVEVKFVVREADTAFALANIGSLLQEAKGKVYEEQVCFFDTGDKTLSASGVILRARKKGGDEKDDSTLKLRPVNGDSVTTEEADALKKEEDWSNPKAGKESWSKDKAITEDEFDEVVQGKKAPNELFETQRNLLKKDRIKDAEWDKLRRYGPIQAKVFKECSLPGFEGKVTVELWQLDCGHSKRPLLEFSVKIDNNDDTAKHAQDFFDEVIKATNAKPDDVSKTRIVLDFLKGH
jgi:hypothetical protein